jgi:N-acetyl sugar amidotransferase
VKYCTRCIYPDTKPDLTFNDAGVCSACQAFDARSTIDWDARELDFQRVVIDAKSEAAERNAPYDCVVPVSGGKDSHYQVLKALDWGLRVLAVTAETDHLSAIGRRNLDNIARLGVDHIEVKTNPVIRRKINRFTLETIGDISWAEHITIFSIPIRIASLMRIPLIIWGENPQNEYGGPAKAQMAIALTQGWLNEFGGLNGLRVDDVESAVGPIGELYRYPPDQTDPVTGEALVSGIFLGQFFPWDGQANARLAMDHGFEVPDQHHVEGSYGNYENLDNYQTGIHDFFKYLKFGFGRATDILCNHIRRGKISRQDAAKLAAEHDGMFPTFYLGKPIKEILKPLDLNVADFLEICETFTNRDLFDGSHHYGIKNRKFSILEVDNDHAD